VERLHKEAWSIIRCKQFDRYRGQIQEQDLEEIASIVNSRPLGFEDNGSIITPATLAFGPAASDKPISTRLHAVREAFYTRHFNELRRRFSTKHLRKELIRIGCNVLIYRPTGYKGDDTFKTARVLAIESAKIKVRCLRDNEILTVSRAQIVPLGQNFQPLQVQETPPGGACGETLNGNSQGGADNELNMEARSE
jgi:hypothetical protein